MAFVLSRDQALSVPLLSTHGKASLLSKNGDEVKVPLAPLLGASSLIKALVADFHLHPGIHGPLIFSFSVNTDVLESVGNITYLFRKSNVKEENVEELKLILK